MAFDLESAYLEALASWPLPRVLTHYGLGQFTTLTPAELKKEPCPFCTRKGKFTARQKSDGRWIARCWVDNCTANRTLDEIYIIQLLENLPDRSIAFKRYLGLANVKVERRPVAERTVTDSDPDSRADAGPAGPNGGDVIASSPGEPDPENIWAVLHSRLSLTDSDRAMLKEKRGFSDATIDELGFKSGNRGNEKIILGMKEMFPDHMLLDSGLFVRDKSGSISPEPQFCGRGITGKKDENGKAIWSNTDPILIPYKDSTGKVTSIRPHKGGIAKKDKDNDEVCGGHVYCPHQLQALMTDDGLAVLTESEFKAAALWQAGLPAIGIPGTSFVRNPLFRNELVAIIEKYSIEILVIVFDNEVKDNPSLPGYKPDPFDRYWTAVWAKYIAWDLMRHSPRPGCLREVRIGQLPDAWRLDADGKDSGKIDWDTALANFVKAEGMIHGTARAAQEFERVINTASTRNEVNDGYPSFAQTVISMRLNRLWRTPLLKSGGEKQERLARRFDRINRNTSILEIAEWASEMATALRSILGAYYIVHAPTEKFKAKLYKVKAKLNDEIATLKKQRNERTAAGIESVEAKLNRLDLERRLIQEKLEGVPERISNFILKCEHCLHTVDGSTERLVSVENTQGEKSGLLRLPGENLGRLAEFRVWCLANTKGVAVWRGGEKDLQALTEDMKYYSAWRNIYEVSHFGYDPRSKIWFAGSDACVPDEKMKNTTTIKPDSNNIFWHGGTGHQIEANPESFDDRFQQGGPLLGSRRGDEDINPRELFQSFSDGMLSTVGDYDGLLAIGMTLFYAAAPEVYRDRGGHPGLWLYGKRGGGKTTIARWLMQIWGFRNLPGIRIDRGTTPVGMNRVLSQYSSLPVWFDEYRRNIPDVEQKESVLRGAFDRSSTAKGRMDGTTKTTASRTLTTPIVSGESSSSDSATRSRYVHVMVAKSRRKNQDDEGNSIIHSKLFADSEHLHLIGRYLMDNRIVFVESTTSFLDSWMKTRTQIADERTRFVHGAGYAAYMALAEMLEINVDAMAFALSVTKHANQAFEDVHDETMVNRFWTDVISAISRGAIPREYFVEKEITLNAAGAYDSAGMELAGASRIRAVFIAAREVFDEYAQDIRKRGDTSPLSKNDIQREILKENYWIEPGGAYRGHRIQFNGRRFGGCWAINLDKFPLGKELEDALNVSPA